MFEELCPYPLHEIPILTIPHCSTVCASATPPTVFDAGIRNLLHNSDMHLACAKKNNRILIQVIIAGDIMFHLLSRSSDLNYHTFLMYIHSYIGYDDSLKKFAFQDGRPRSSSQLLFLGKTLSSF